MENKYLSYYGGEDKEFFDNQQIIKEDIDRLIIYISDFEKTKERDSLLLYLKNIQKSILLNKFKNKIGTEKELPEGTKLIINISDEYLLFDYYDKSDIENQDFLYYLPLRAIISRNMREFIFIGGCEVNLVNCFYIKDKKITEKFTYLYELCYDFENGQEYVKLLKQKVE